MKGRVIGYDSTTYKGAINGQDGQRYDFVMQDWRGTATPQVNGEVDFLAADSHAREIYPTVAARSRFHEFWGGHRRVLSQIRLVSRTRAAERTLVLCFV